MQHTLPRLTVFVHKWMQLDRNKYPVSHTAISRAVAHAIYIGVHDANCVYVETDRRRITATVYYLKNRSPTGKNPVRYRVRVSPRIRAFIDSFAPNNIATFTLRTILKEIPFT